MLSNIYQVINESDLDEIFTNHSDKIIIVMYAKRKCKPCRKFKSTFVEISKKYNESIFLYIDVENFENTGKYISKIKSTPTFKYYYDNEQLVTICGPDKKIFEEKLNIVLNSLKAYKHQNNDDVKNDANDANVDITNNVETIQISNQSLSTNKTSDDQQDSTQEPIKTILFQKKRPKVISNANSDKGSFPTDLTLEQLQKKKKYERLNKKLHAERLLKIKRYRELKKEKENREKNPS